MAKESEGNQRRWGSARAALREPRGWLRIVLLTLFFFCLEYVDLFGLSQATEQYSRSLVYQVLAPLKPSPNREKITMVMLDDRDLEAFDENWPAPYGFHAVILQHLLEKRPAAVFVDIAFIDERQDDSIKDLVEVAKAYRAAGVPLIIAGTPGEEPYPEGIRSELVGEVEVAPVPGGRSEQQGIIYPLCQNGRRTAALAIYEALGLQVENAKALQGDPCASGHPPLPDMEISWKITDQREHAKGDPDTVLDNYTSENCEITTREWPGRVARLMAHETLGNDNDLRNPCPYHTTLSIQDVLSGNEVLKQVLEGRVIVYGAELMMAADQVEPPTHKPLAAAHYHAMALNNLLDRHADYRYVENSDAFFTPSTVLLLLCLLTMMVAAFFFERLIDKVVPNFCTPGSPDGVDTTGLQLFLQGGLLLLWTACSVLIVFTFAYLAFNVFNLGVTNWAALLFIALIRAYDRLMDFCQNLIKTAGRRFSTRLFGTGGSA